MVYIIAEIGNTHEGSLGLAKKFISSAAECGVNAVKFQTHIFEEESIDSAPNPPYFNSESRKDYFTRTSFKLGEYQILKEYSEKVCKVDFLSSPFSIAAVNFLNQVPISTFKIPSGEVTNIPLLAEVAKLGKKIILSSGMSNWNELSDAVNTITQHCQPDDLTILQCTSEYPCPPENSGINLLSELQSRFPNIRIGYSDHTLGFGIPLAAVALGCEVIEKHFTLSKKMYGSDAKNSMEPDEFARLVHEIRSVEKGLSSPFDKDKKAIELSKMKEIFEKSIVSQSSLNVGKTLTIEDIAYKKPGTGISPKEYKKIIGKKLKRQVPKNHPFSFDDFY